MMTPPFVFLGPERAAQTGWTPNSSKRFQLARMPRTCSVPLCVSRIKSLALIRA